MLTREQRIERRRFVGSSDIPAIVGLDKRKGPHAIWMQKVSEDVTCVVCGGGGVVDCGGLRDEGCVTCDGTGIVSSHSIEEERDVEITPADVGSVAEPLIARLYAQRTGRTITKVDRTIVHPERPWQAAAPDYVGVDGGPDVEIKMVGAWMAEDWGDDDEAIPAWYRAQVEWQMDVRRKHEQHVAALIGGTDFRLYTIRRDERLIADLVESGRLFWNDYVLARVPPPLDGSPSAGEYLSARFKRELVGMKPAPLEAMGLVAELREIKARLKADEERRDTLETHLKALILDAEGINDPAWGKVTWKAQAGGVSWKGIAEDLTVMLAMERSREIVANTDHRNTNAIEVARATLTRELLSLHAKHRGEDVRVLREAPPPKPKALKAKRGGK
jgi:predicted phage-related endonuclease